MSVCASVSRSLIHIYVSFSECSACNIKGHGEFPCSFVCSPSLCESTISCFRKLWLLLPSAKPNRLGPLLVIHSAAHIPIRKLMFPVARSGQNTLGQCVGGSLGAKTVNRTAGSCSELKNYLCFLNRPLANCCIVHLNFWHYYHFGDPNGPHH